MNQHPDPKLTRKRLNAEQLLAGVIELTPEAREILTKHINQKIVWGYRITKTIFYLLSGLPLLGSLFFGLGVTQNGIHDLLDVAIAIVLIGGPIVFSKFLVSLIRKL